MPLTRRRLLQASLLSLGTYSSASVAKPVNKPYQLTVVPQFPAADINRAWSPILQHILDNTGIAIELSFAPNIPQFEGAFLNGLPDMIYCNPYHVVMAKRSSGYLPAVRDASPLSGQLVVLKNSGIKHLSDLKNEVILFPAPNAFGASLLIRATLTNKYHLPFAPKYVSTHSNVVRGLLHGDAKAGGMIATTIAREPDEIKQQLAVLIETPQSAPHPIAFHPRVPKEHRTAITQAIVALGQLKPELLAPVPMKNPVTADYNRDYKPLEALGIEQFVVLSR